MTTPNLDNLDEHLDTELRQFNRDINLRVAAFVVYKNLGERMKSEQGQDFVSGKFRHVAPGLREAARLTEQLRELLLACADLADPPSE